MIRSKKKIIQLVTSIHLGGAEVVAFNISESCSEKNSNAFEFIIVELFPTKDQYAIAKRKELSSKKIRIKTLSKTSKRFSLIFAPWSLLIFLIKEKPQLIHSHTDLPDFVLSTTLKIINLLHIKHAKIVRTIHNTVLWPNHPIIGKFTESSFQNDLVVGVSEASLHAYKQLRSNYQLEISKKSEIIYNGCSKPVNENAPFPISDQTINIAFCGRFEHQKGIDILIERIRKINIKYYELIQFYLIGDGTYKQLIIELANEYKNVQHFPPINNISNKLHNFDFIILPSRFEGLVLISIEASYARVPVIAARAPGLSETLPLDWPLFFNLDDSQSLMDIIRKIVEHKFDIQNLKDQVESFVTEKFSREKMADLYFKLYLSETFNKCD